MSLPIDEAIRLQALDPRQSFIVQAPAGSGKTELLIQRYLLLLGHVKHYPEEILAITFTRKAASEMRARVIEALIAAKEAAPCPDHQRRTRDLANKVLVQDEHYQWQLCDNPHRLRIVTIDALCASLVARMPLLSQVGGMPRISDNPGELYQQAALNTLTQTFDDPDYQQAITRLLIHCDNRLETVQRLLCELLAKREQWLPFLVEHHGHQQVREQLESSLTECIVSQLEQTRIGLEGLHNHTTLLSLARNAANYLLGTDTQQSITACAELDGIPEAHIEQLPLWRGLADLLIKADGEIRKTVTVAQGFPAPSQFSNKEEKALWKSCKSDFIECLAGLEEHPTLGKLIANLKFIPSPTYTDDQWYVIDALMTLLPVAAAQCLLIFQQAGEVDFTQISQAALTALGHSEEPSELALALDKRLQHILVDEFQDTSISHCRLLNSLTQGWEYDDGRSLFVVGDPMQSIYRFRQARVDLFIQAKQFGLGNVALTPLTLQVNFRSSQQVVDWNNQLFQQIFPKKDEANLAAIAYSPSVAYAENITDSGAYTHFTDTDDTCGAQVIQLIQEAQRADPTQTIAVLVRSRSHLDDTLTRLRTENIAYHASDIEALLSQPAIQDCLALTCAVDHLADQLAWLSVLRAPWCGLTLTDLMALVQQDPAALLLENALAFETNTVLSIDARRRLRHLIPILQQTLAHRHSQSLAQCVYATWLALDGPATLGDAAQIEHIEKYFHLLADFEHKQTHFDKQAFRVHCEQEYLPHPQEHDELNPPVEVMTIHKSKGLEFDIVIIPGLERGSRGNQSGLLNWTERYDADQETQMLLAPIKSASESEDLHCRYVDYFNAQKDHYELIRLLYVACTRAKKQLHLLAKKPKSHKPMKTSLLALLWPALSETQRSTCAAPLLSDSGLATLNLNEITRFPSSWYKPSTKATAFIPAQQQTYKPLCQQDNVPSIIGTVIHDVIQSVITHNVNLQTLDIESAVPYWQARLLADKHPRSSITEGVERIKLALTNLKQSTKAQWLVNEEHQNKQTEYAITHIENGERQHFRIDYTFIDAKETRWIIDFKTAQPQQHQSVEAFLDQQKLLHAKQLETYAHLFRGDHNGKIKLGLYFPLTDGWIEWQYMGVNAAH